MHLTTKTLFCFLFFVFFPLRGFCIFDMGVVKDINSAYDSCSKKQTKEVKQKNIDMESDCKKKMSDVMKKHFPAGSSAEAAIKILDNEGFTMVEYRRDSWRKLPSGVLIPYNTVGFKIGATDGLLGERKVHAEKSIRLDWIYLFISPISFMSSAKEIRVTFNVDKDGNIIDSSCSAGISTI